MRTALFMLCGAVACVCISSGCTNYESPLKPAEPSSRGAVSVAAVPDANASADWSVTLDNIEACSCPTFCQCYFNDRPALHEAGKEGHEHAMRYCRFNNAFQVDKGHYANTSLDGMKFWMAGDLGGDFSKGQMDWAVLHFEPSASPEQREAAKAIVAAIFAVKWNSFTVGADAKIDWQKSGDGAEAKLNGGKSAQIVLKQTLGSDGKPVVLQNVKFWSAPRNNGFEIMSNEIEAYHEGDRAFEFHHTNGFFTRIEMGAKDGHAAHASASGARLAMTCATGSCCEK